MSQQWIAAAIVGSVFALLFILEKISPLRGRTFALGRRLFLNFILSATALITAMLLIRPAVLSLIQWSGDQPFGLLQWIPMPPWLQLAAGLLLLDLSFYYWHIANHRIPFLWRFHNVHHIDPDLDVSTGFRFHFGEVALSTLFRTVQVLATGVPLWIYALYEILFQANTLFHHSNLRLPIRLERFLNKIIVTPRMHGIHHSDIQSEANSNYSVVFSWWDRLHFTIRLNIAQSKLRIGVPAYKLPSDHRLWNCFTLPFQTQRDYWSSPEGNPTSRPAAEMTPDKQSLAE